MNKNEALKEMCEGKIAESSNGNHFRLSTNCKIQKYKPNLDGWEDNYPEFKAAQFDGWIISEGPIDGHDWQWAMERCDAGVKVRWHDAGKYNILEYDAASDGYCISFLTLRTIPKKYFTKKGWVLA